MLAAVDLLAAKAELARRTDARRARTDATTPRSRSSAGAIRCSASAPCRSRSRSTMRRACSSSAGPNMGGKTVALKMAGLFVVDDLLRHAAARGGGTRIGRFERVVADIGDEQSLAANASTFSAHLERMREILDGAGRANARDRRRDRRRNRTERRRGAGASRCWSGCSNAARAAIVSTHSIELKLFAHATPGVANASVRFDPKTFAPTFELDVGTPGQSLAFPLARALGIDPRRSSSAPRRCSSGASATTRRRWPSLPLRNASCARNARGLEAERREAIARARALARERARARRCSGAASRRGRKNGCSRACAISCASCSGARRNRAATPSASARQGDARRRRRCWRRRSKRCAATSGFVADERPRSGRSADLLRPAIACASSRSIKRASSRKITTKGCSFRSVQ